MRAARTGAALFALFAVAGFTASGPAGEAARRAEEAQAAVPRAIDCDRLGAVIDVQAETSAGASRAAAPLGSLLKVRLQELRSVSPLVAPGEDSRPPSASGVLLA